MYCLLRNYNFYLLKYIIKSLTLLTFYSLLIDLRIVSPLFLDRIKKFFVNVKQI